MVSKDSMQESILQAWRAAGGRSTLEGVTGIGKSILLKKAADKRLEYDENSVIHYVVPSLILKDQAKALLDKRVEVFVINTYIKHPRKCHLLLLDEVHKCAAITFSKVFEIVRQPEKNVLPFILGATASLERLDDRHHIITRYIPIIRSIGYEEALANNWICPFEMINIGVPRPANYDEVNNSFRADLAFFHDNRGLMFSCMSYRGAEQFIADNRLGMQPGEVIGIAKRCLRGMRERNELIYESDEKLVKAKQLIEENPDRKIITFSLTKTFARRITEETKDSVCIDSDMGKKAIRQALEDFKSGKYRILNTIKMCEEGIDIPEADMGIIISTTSAERRVTQSGGRLCRYIPGKKAIIYCLYLIDTKEKWTLKKAQAKIPNVRWI